MTKSHDDLDAIRTITDALVPFDPKDQSRIIRWACEKLDISLNEPANPGPQSPEEQDPPRSPAPTIPSRQPAATNIKTFVTDKSPNSDNQFAATVAYYYAFEAPEADRKGSIDANDLQEACRQIGRTRLGDPGKTLRNAHSVGVLDKSGDRGAYKINTVGENLVAVTLPSDASASPPTRKKRSSGKKTASKKKRSK